MQQQPTWLAERLQRSQRALDQLLLASKVPFDERLHGRLPNEQGIYAIYVGDARDGEVLRADRTKEGQGGLQQRVYRNHLIACPSCAQQLSIPAAGDVAIRCPTCTRTFRKSDLSGGV